MKQLVILGGFASVLALGVSSYMAIGSRLLPSDLSAGKTTTVSSPTSRLPVPPAGAVEDAKMLVGAYTLVRESDGSVVRAQIRELVWGIRHDGNIGLAVFKAVKDDGQEVDYNRPEAFERLAFAPAELDNCYFKYKDGSRVAVEHITYRVDDLGMMAIGEWIGRDRDGRGFTYDDVSGRLWFVGDPDPIPPSTTCCRKVTITECLTDNGCTAGCAGTTSCACTAPAGSSCYLQDGPQCRGACGGICHTGDCGGTPPNCACH